MVYISLDHPYRLRAIADSAFAFLREAGFVVESSSYSRESLTGQLDLRSASARLRLFLRNDDLDMTIMAAGAAQGPSFRIGEVVQFLDDEPVDYLKFRERLDNPPPPRFNEAWEYVADLLRVNLNRIVALIERGDLTALRTRMDAYFVERSAEFLRQERAYRDAKRASRTKPKST
jgi:hypothetical protein